jgi:hypothetical protein
MWPAKTSKARALAPVFHICGYLPERRGEFAFKHCSPTCAQLQSVAKGAISRQSTAQGNRVWIIAAG